MGHYSIDREFAIARYSTENLIYHATWPTEWISHSIFMAYADYLHTGNTDLISNYYDDLKAKTMMALETEKGLISTQTGLQTKEFLKSIHYNGGGLKDIVDWPHGNMSTIPGGETDNYDFKTYNTVVNAFYYKSLVYMTEIAKVLGKTDDMNILSTKAQNAKNAFNIQFFNKETGIYVDGIDSKHSSLHANMYALAFGLVPVEHQKSVIEFIKSRRMACGVYSSHYLLEAMFDYGQAEYAMSLITDTADRSWLNMIRVGATMTTEAWDNKYKVNNGWSHAWSAAPVHILPRKLLGIEPAEAGFGKINIRPQPAGILQAEAKIPSIRGEIEAAYTMIHGKSFGLNVTLPANTVTTVYVPVVTPHFTLIHNGKKVKYTIENGYAVVRNVGSGMHKFILNKNAKRFKCDFNKVGFAGSSAGTPLSAVAAQKNAACKLYIGIYGKYDFVNKNLGGYWPSKQTLEKYKIITPDEQKRASAVWQIRKNPPATLLIHGDADPTIGNKQSIAFADSIMQKGGIAKAVILPDVKQ
jgi:hypothetical protein